MVCVVLCLRVHIYRMNSYMQFHNQKLKDRVMGVIYCVLYLYLCLVSGVCVECVGLCYVAVLRGANTYRYLWREIKTKQFIVLLDSNR